MKKALPLILALVVLCALVWIFVLKKDEPSPAPKPPVVQINHPPREFVPQWEWLDVYQNTISAAEFQSLIENVYAVGDTWKEVIEINEERAVIQTSETGEPFVLNFLPEGSKRPDDLERYWETGPLETLHIAIDPGHIGGDFAGIEQRQFGKKGDKLVREGEIALLTAKRLKTLLEQMGVAKVSLVRSTNEPVTKLRSADFLKLYREYNPKVPAGLLKPWANKRFYRRAEIVARAEIVNNLLQPDMVLCLHYNASSGSADWASPRNPVLVDENHFHLLLNGAFTSGEVLDEGERFQMVERILQGIHPREVELAKVVADVFAERTGLPPYTYDPNSSRAKNVAGHPYLWARNLLANRSYTCPVLFFEPWVMNNKEVYERIQLGDYEGLKTVGGEEKPSIMKEYAEAVAAGIKKFHSEASP